MEESKHGRNHGGIEYPTLPKPPADGGHPEPEPEPEPEEEHDPAEQPQEEEGEQSLQLVKRAQRKVSTKESTKAPNKLRPRPQASAGSVSSPSVSSPTRRHASRKDPLPVTTNKEAKLRAENMKSAGITLSELLHMDSLNPSKWPLQETTLPPGYDINARGLYKETTPLHRRIANQAAERPDPTYVQQVSAGGGTSLRCIDAHHNRNS
jgi:hypothetical protein